MSTCGFFLHINLKWPPCIYDPEEVFCDFLNGKGPDAFADYHPRYTAFIQALRKFRARADLPVETNSRARLPFRVNKHREFENNSTKGAVSVMFELRSVDESYAPPTPNKPFFKPATSAVTDESNGN